LPVLFRPHVTTLCSSSLSWRSRPEKLPAAAELSRCLQSTSSSPAASPSASSHTKDDDDAEGTVSVPVDPDADDGWWCSAAVLSLRHVSVVAVDVVVSVVAVAE
jgi:hypothetical protein